MNGWVSVDAQLGYYIRSQGPIKFRIQSKNGVRRLLLGTDKQVREGAHFRVR